MSITIVTGLDNRIKKVFDKEAKMSDVIVIKANIKEDNPLYGITKNIEIEIN